MKWHSSTPLADREKEKKIEQKPAESNDIKSILLVHDEILNNLLERYKTSTTFKTLIVNLKNWWDNTRRHLLSFNIEQKSAWGEEDEENYKVMEKLLNEASCYSCTSGADKILNWLKSLKPQNRWKPSDEQMKHFQDEIHYIPDELNVYSDEYEKWKEDFLDDCGLYARHIIRDEIEREENNPYK